MVNWRGYICLRYMCILLYVKLIWCSGIPYIYGQLEGGLGICAYCYMWNFCGVAVFHTSMVNWRGEVHLPSKYMCILLYLKLICSVVVYHRSMVNWRRGLWYMCILLYVKLLWCTSIPYIYHQLEGVTSALSMCAFHYMWNLCSVVVFHRSVVNWRRGPWYMCILLYVKLLWCSSIPYIYGSLKGVTSAQIICVISHVWNLFGVVVYHTSVVNWRGLWYMSHSCYIWNIMWCSGIPYIYGQLEGGLWYMCILLYVKLMWCSSIPYIYGQLERGYICHKYVCILPYVKLMWCSGILEIYGWLEGGTCARGICAYCYMLNLCSVVVFHTSMVNWRRGPWYMCILLYVKPLSCTGIPYIYHQLEGGLHLP